ncbi:NAD(P)-dependent alcohol dehydrogenase [Paenibacillus algorifonticola]|nr:NAD(P)-dependent alcohol dehydrogenase [Paenibacillus algorifonticola]
MKAVFCTKYGAPEVLQLKEVNKPAPQDNEILIKVYATSVTSGDCRVRGFKSPFLYRLPMRLFLGITRPRQPILGVELTGEVEAVGKDVKKFNIGDAVYAFTGMRFGAYAEYVCLSENGMVTLKPANISYEEAAAVLFGGTTALHFFRKGQLQSGQKMLIYGASGAVGTSAVQLAKHFGADVTGVCSTSNVEWVRALGADHVIDYALQDFAETGKRYDIILDAVGKTSKAHARKALTPNGKFISVEGQGVAKVLVEDLLFLKDLIEDGELKGVIDKSYPLEKIAEAHRYVDQGHKKGNVVITVQ